MGQGGGEVQLGDLMARSVFEGVIHAETLHAIEVQSLQRLQKAALQRVTISLTKWPG